MEKFVLLILTISFSNNVTAGGSIEPDVRMGYVNNEMDRVDKAKSCRGDKAPVAVDEIVPEANKAPIADDKIVPEVDKAPVADDEIVPEVDILTCLITIFPLRIYHIYLLLLF